MRRKRDIRLSVSRKNQDIFIIWKAIQTADPNPSSTVIRWIRERYQKEWSTRHKPVLPQRQQDKLITISPKRGPQQKTQDEIRYEQEQAEAQRVRDEHRRRKKQEELDSIRKLIKS